MTGVLIDMVSLKKQPSGNDVVQYNTSDELLLNEFVLRHLLFNYGLLAEIQLGQQWQKICVYVCVLFYSKW